MSTTNKSIGNNRISKELPADLYFTKRQSLNQIGARFHVHPFSIGYLMDKFKLKRRSPSEAVYNHFNKEECFKIQKPLRSSELLKNIALTLYWCEGTGDRKDEKRTTTLAFTNTDKAMLRIWIKFLLEICGLDRKKIRIRLYLHKNQRGDSLKKYWAKELKIPSKQFENISYTKKNSTREHYKGTVKIKVHNLKLYILVKTWIDDLKKKIAETYKLVI